MIYYIPIYTPSHTHTQSLGTNSPRNSGPTRMEDRLCEAQSYANLAASYGYFSLLPDSPRTADRILIEDRALDSFHNVIFSLALFWRREGAWPERVTIVSHA